MFKKTISILLVAIMVLSLAACSKSGDNEAKKGDSAGKNTASDSGNNVISPLKISAADPNAKQEEITIGTWWQQYYDSSHNELADDPDFDADSEPDVLRIARLKLENVRKLEKKYGMPIYWKNLTYDGVKDSINTSIITGEPDCDIYLVEVAMGLPAQAQGLALDLKTILPEDDDMFTDNVVVNYLDIGDGKCCIFYRISVEKTVESTQPLAFNVQMLQRAGLEDPRDLYDRNEWTWDKFIEYCKILTKDTDGDGKTDQYGFCGYAHDVLDQLLMSNGAAIAAGPVQTLTTPEVGESLKMLYDMYNTYDFCYPYDFAYDEEGNSTGIAAHDTMRFKYREGNIAFYPGAAWINGEYDDYDYQGKKGERLPFDTAYVRWPVGPSGNKETNYGKNGVSTGEFYIIPASVAEPEKVYQYLYDYWNWYDSDISLRDDKGGLTWWYSVTSYTDENRERNFECMKDCGEHTGIDLWQSLNFYFNIEGLVRGTLEPGQFQETYKQQVQLALDAYFGNMN